MNILARIRVGENLHHELIRIIITIVELESQQSCADQQRISTAKGHLTAALQKNSHCSRLSGLVPIRFIISTYRRRHRQ